MELNSRLSEAAYVGTCFYIGTPTQVRIRRQVIDIKEVVMRPVWIMRGLDRIESGSNREGFRLQSSDIDFMVWLSNHKVICDLSQIGLYRKPQHTVILMEYEELPPGFTRLILKTPSVDRIVNLSCATINDKKYISSLLFKNGNHLNSKKLNLAVVASSREHGPCETFNVHGLDIDCAHCFRSHHWPNAALPWIQRCQLQKWPQINVLFAIVEEGCHIVPIGTLPEEDYEWRISFSGAEKKLVYSMNHCQFLCYGLLKFFLKEVINSSFLCSYFMKTIMFWVIQCNRSLHWVPTNLLECFWTCFKVLLSYVYKGECPNFFIPQNNMFRVKIVGHAQASMFEQLHALYDKGITCLLRSPTIASFLGREILDRILTFRTDESSLTSLDALKVSLYEEIIFPDGIVAVKQEEFVNSIIVLEQVQNTRTTFLQKVTAQMLLSELLRNFSCSLSSKKRSEVRNKELKYDYDKALNMMKLAVKKGCATEIVYLAIHYYRFCQYKESLRCLQRAEERMSKPNIIYMHNATEEMVRNTIANIPPCVELRKRLLCSITLFFEYRYIDELVTEQEASVGYTAGSLFIPPLVMLHMLFFLNHHKLGDTVKSQQSLRNLHTLLLNDDGTHVPEHFRDISWQILGICQQTCGDYMGALISFMFSLSQFPFHGIHIATMQRIQSTALSILFDTA